MANEIQWNRDALPWFGKDRLREPSDQDVCRSCEGRCFYTDYRSGEPKPLVCEACQGKGRVKDGARKIEIRVGDVLDLGYGDGYSIATVLALGVRVDPWQHTEWWVRLARPYAYASRVVGRQPLLGCEVFEATINAVPDSWTIINAGFVR